MRIRTVKPAMWESEKVGTMTILARLNFLGLISMADDAGRGRGSIGFIRSRLHAYAGDVTDELMEASIQELVTAKLVRFYMVEGCSYFELPGWKEHQKIDRPSASPIPAPEDSTSPQRELIEPSLLEGKGREVEGRGREGKTRAADIAATLIPEDLKAHEEAIKDWLAYKREKGQTYKPKGMEALWRSVRGIPGGRVREAVDHCMGNNYSGLFPAKGATDGKASNRLRLDVHHAEGAGKDAVTL